jgi:hypothetical protein
MYCHFFMDPPYIEEKEEEESYTGKFHLIDHPEPLEFDLDPDRDSVEDGNTDEDAQLQFLLGR